VVQFPRGEAPLVASPAAAKSLRGGGGGLDVTLLLYFAGWYLGNYYYTINNKYALKAAGGATGFPVTIGFLQLVLGSLYGLFLWIAPDARAAPNVSASDLLKLVPVAA